MIEVSYFVLPSHVVRGCRLPQCSNWRSLCDSASRLRWKQQPGYFALQENLP